MVHCVWCSLVVLKAWPWLRGSSWTPHEGLGLGLDTSGLVLGRGLERKVLALALAKTFPHDPGHVVAVRVCSAQTHSVT